MIHHQRVKKVLVEYNLLNPQEIDRVEREIQNTSTTLLEYLIQKKLLDRKQFYNALAKNFDVPFLELTPELVDQRLFQLLPRSLIEKHGLVIFAEEKDGVKVAMVDPDDLEMKDVVKKKLGKPLQIFLTSPDSIRSILQTFHKGLEAEFQNISEQDVASQEATKVLSSSEPTQESRARLQKLAQNIPVIRIVDTILEYAILENASDIHIEPTEHDLVVRYRTDGILRDVMHFPVSLMPSILARIKVLSNLKLDEHRLPQDGRFSVEQHGVKISLRVAILPVYDGEKVTIRLLNPSNQILTLEQLGLHDQALASIKNNSKKPHGLLLVTGPTGSGKTSTLYTILNMLNTPQVSIFTIEDPIEYRIPRINQSQVNPKIGFTFATGLRALLRQDPNIIMVGEIRDQETAEICAHAAMTGHLVLSTLHTNDAVTALPRLEDLGVPSFLIASITNIIIAQRLVRKVCENCAHTYTLSKDTIHVLQEQFNIPNLLSQLTASHLLPKEKVSIEKWKFTRGDGCSSCNHMGYRGRIGVFEVLEVDEVVSPLVLKSSPAALILEKAIEKGMITLAADGLYKALKGITTIEEVLRVMQE